MTQQFVAVAADQFGNRIDNLSFEWSLDGSQGIIDKAGLFKAGKEPGTFDNLVKVTYSGTNMEISAYATVTVEPERIIFISNRMDETPYMFYVDSQGENIERVSPTPVFAWKISWSPDGRRLVYDTSAYSFSFLATINDDGSWEDLLTMTGDENEPAWSPDGNQIAYTSWSDETESYEIFVMDIDGGSPTQITSTPGGDIYVPNWSPDGTKFVYDYTPAGQAGDIYTIGSDGSNPKRITRHAGNETSPVFSPDGSKIVFYGNRDGDSDIYVVNSDGTNLINLTASSGSEDLQPDWSPDGSHIVFMSDRDSVVDVSSEDLDEDYSIDLYVIKSDGGVAKRITSDQSLAWVPAWAPPKAGLDISKESVVIPGKSELPKSLNVQAVTSESRSAVVKIETENGCGSGFILDPEGIIITNNHVILDTKEITVFLDDGTEYEATISSREMIPDIALLEIKPEIELPYLKWGDVGTLDLGEQVVVLGYPLDSETISISSGFVSSVDFDKGRGITWIKTDSAINPGNSGGPLLNLQGQVVGIVSLKMVDVSVEGIGYAVSSNTVKGYLPDMLSEVINVNIE